MHCHSPVGLPVDGCWRGPNRDLRPWGDGWFDEGAGFTVAGATAIIGCQRGWSRRGGHDVDRVRRRGSGGVVVVGGRGGDGRGVVIAQLLPQTVLHVLVGQGWRVAYLVL